MATRKKAATTAKVRASVGKERQLALALRALLDSLADVPIKHQEGVTEAEMAAGNVLANLGYGNLVGLPKLKRELEAELKNAFAASDYATVTKLSAQLERVKLGKSLKSIVVPVVKKPSSRKNGQAPIIPSAEVETGSAGDVNTESEAGVNNG